MTSRQVLGLVVPLETPLSPSPGQHHLSYPATPALRALAEGLLLAQPLLFSSQLQLSWPLPIAQAQRRAEGPKGTPRNARGVQACCRQVFPASTTPEP